MIIAQTIMVSILLILSWGFIIFGMFSIFKLKNLYTRILSATTIDTMASLTIIIALFIFRIDSYQYALRFLLLIGFLLITNPISSHVNIRSAYVTGYELESIKGESNETKEGDVNG